MCSTETIKLPSRLYHILHLSAHRHNRVPGILCNTVDLLKVNIVQEVLYSYNYNIAVCAIYIASVDQVSVDEWMVESSI